MQVKRRFSLLRVCGQGRGRTADFPLFRLTDNSSRTKRRPTRLLLGFEGLQCCGRPGPTRPGAGQHPGTGQAMMVNCDGTRSRSSTSRPGREGLTPQCSGPGGWCSSKVQQPHRPASTPSGCYGPAADVNDPHRPLCLSMVRRRSTVRFRNGAPKPQVTGRFRSWNRPFYTVVQQQSAAVVSGSEPLTEFRQRFAGRGRDDLGVDLHRDGDLAVPQDLHGDTRVDIQDRLT
jgi:hypothetical protein